MKIYNYNSYFLSRFCDVEYIFYNPIKQLWSDGDTQTRKPKVMKDFIIHYDYQTMREAGQNFCQELTEYVFHPVRLLRLSEAYSLEFGEYIEIIS